MQVSATTDHSKPHAIELLGMQLVLWRDTAGQWHCMEDACPHRCVVAEFVAGMLPWSACGGMSFVQYTLDGNMQCAYALV